MTETETKPKPSADPVRDGGKPADSDDSYAWGFDMYPERRGSKHQRNWFKTLIGIEGREGIAKLKCERNVYKCLQTSPLVRLLVGALRSSGCDFDIRRHVSCEMCSESVTGGYDPELNQVVICQNTARSTGVVQGVLTHELIHMFDYCRNDLNFKNIDHLACTEIRAANLAHCSFLSAWVQGFSSILDFKQTHEICVKEKALASIMAVHKTTEEQARAAIERVFGRCYSDLEPIGRRIRRNSLDMEKAFLEGPYYGYDT